MASSLLDHFFCIDSKRVLITELRCINWLRTELESAKESEHFYTLVCVRMFCVILTIKERGGWDYIFKVRVL